MKKITIKKILGKKNKNPIVCLSVYSKVLAEIADKYCDIILVGDSLGMTLHGMKTTREVKIENMIMHGKTVKKFSKRCLVVVDMPYNTYLSKSEAYRNAKKIIKQTNCDAVKLEGGMRISNIIKHLTNKGIPVMGHVGLLPQFTNKFKFKGKDDYQKKKILRDAIRISECGVFAIVIECVVEDLAKKITSCVKVPTIGIGASKYCDGQILVGDDILGLTDYSPKFVKRYSNLKKVMINSIKKYAEDVKIRKFPTTKNVYR